MAGAPPDNYKKYMKQGDDGRWYWDDANNPDNITSDLKDDGKHPYTEAAAAVGYNMADAISGSKVERWKPPAEEKGKVEQIFGKPVTMTEQQWNQYYGGKAPAVSPTAASVASASPAPASPAGQVAAGGSYVQGDDGKMYFVPSNGKMPVPAADGPPTPSKYTMMDDGPGQWTAAPGGSVDAKGNPSTAHAVDPQTVHAKQPAGSFGPSKPVAAPAGFNPMAEYGTESRPGAAPKQEYTNSASAQDINDTSGKIWNTWTPPGTAAKGIYAENASDPMTGRIVRTEDLRKAPDEFQSPSPVKRTWAATPDEQLYHDMMAAESIKSATPTPPWSAGPSPASRVYVDPKTGKTIQLGTQVQYPPGAAMLPKNNPWYAEGGPKGANAPIKAAESHPWGGAPAPELKVANYGDAENPWKPAPEAPAPGSMKVSAAPYAPSVPMSYTKPPTAGPVKVKPMPAPEIDPVLQDEIDGGGNKAQMKALKKGGDQLDKLNAKNKGKKKIEVAKS